MRKSLLKTPPSGLSSRPDRPAAALVAVGVGRRRQSERNGSHPYGSMAPLGADVDPGFADVELDPTARLRLLETLVSRADIGECAQAGLQWLDDTLGITRSLCLLRPSGEAVLL